MGSPYRMTPGDRNATTPPWERVEHLHDSDLPLSQLAESDRPPLTVPATSIYPLRRRRELVHVHRRHRTGRTEPAGENIEVYGSHTGLGLNPAVMVAILDRLAQPEDDWQQFRSPIAMRPFYPRLVAWTPASDSVRT